MKHYLLLAAIFLQTFGFAQEKKIFENEVTKISKTIDSITNTEKDALKSKIKALTTKVKRGEVSPETAELLKKEYAAYHAKQIELKVSKQERLLQQLVQDKTNGKITNTPKLENNTKVNTFKVGKSTFTLSLDNTKEKKKKKVYKKKNRRSTSQFIFALGVNNVLVNNKLGSLENSDYKFWKSHFYELGFSWKTRVAKEASKFYVKYGVSFLWNNLRPKDNLIHVNNGPLTELETFNTSLDESRLRHVQMNFPLHLEWDFSKNKTYKDGFVLDRTGEGVRVGVGGFIGFKLGTRQYLEYRNSRNANVKELEYNNFNMNTVNYGLSAYVGYKTTSFYVKYDLNPLFQDTNIRNLSLGIRFDFD